MKKRWVWTILSMLVAGIIFVSCSDDSTSEPNEPENSSPTCAITSPSANAQFFVGDEINVSVEANDEDGTISEVRFYFDNIGISSDNSFPYSFMIETNEFEIGNHIIKAVSKDNEGAEKTSEIVIVLLKVPPFITITSPTSESEFELGESCDITWEDNIDENVKIELYKSDILNQVVTESTESNGIYSWTVENILENGDDYQIKISSVDNSDLFDSSESFKISGATLDGMVLVQGGTFQMGDHFNEGPSDELPVHDVTLSDFYIGKYEVTQEEWQSVMTGNTNGISTTPSNFTGSDKPVEQVSWYDVIVFCNRKSIQEGLTPVYSINNSTNPDDWGNVPTSSNSTWDAAVCEWTGNGYRLPTEAEWEYAARGGIHHTDNFRYSGCHETSDLTNYAWCSTNSSGQTNDVGTKLANQLGIYDMSGNVYEWCWDWWGTYSSSPQQDPHGPNSGIDRILRGGNWDWHFFNCRVAFRANVSPNDRYLGFGFRLSRTE
ncbi:MAG: SUMF1/EgtB/PvdO family nonheme iron enzyme [Candidatus Delongbacteria bacterium]|nr:SUMF1/EgtB/PvdO family nonheme iron enzyme [Candidatus Delongbacteria bacterium]MBN2835738.1 SUMF1/EgtB/PvdO family nonheme iron enzyme [Candidatus Delongbacteria bacterium]